MTSIEKEIRNGDYTVGLNGVAVIENCFAQDIIIAGMFGASRLESYMKQAFEEWKKDIRYLTALAITANHIGWKYYNEGQQGMSKMMFNWWHKLDAFILAGKSKGDDYIYRNFTGEEVQYFIQACD